MILWVWPLSIVCSETRIVSSEYNSFFYLIDKWYIIWLSSFGGLFGKYRRICIENTLPSTVTYWQLLWKSYWIYMCQKIVILKSKNGKSNASMGSLFLTQQNSIKSYDCQFQTKKNLFMDHQIIARIDDTTMSLPKATWFCI